MSTLKEYAPVAQLDRVFDYESKGRGFESRRAYQNKKPVNADKYGIHGLFVFYFCGMNYAQITEKKTVLIAKMQVRIPIEIIDLFDGNLRTGF